jgi:hypothetical protein
MTKRKRKAATASTRGGKVGQRAKTPRDSQDIRRLLNAAGSREEMIKWVREEPWPEEFDNKALPLLAIMEETPFGSTNAHAKPSAPIGNARLN